VITIKKENDELNLTIDRLKALIEASKKVDAGVEGKRRKDRIGGICWQLVKFS
jgi:hypothetical protein